MANGLQWWEMGTIMLRTGHAVFFVLFLDGPGVGRQVG